MPRRQLLFELARTPAVNSPWARATMVATRSVRMALMAGTTVRVDKPEHLVIVDSIGLDTFEVTVARFRNFVSAFDGTPPQAGRGPPSDCVQRVAIELERRAADVAGGTDQQPEVCDQ